MISKQFIREKYEEIWFYLRTVRSKYCDVNKNVRKFDGIRNSSVGSRVWLWSGHNHSWGIMRDFIWLKEIECCKLVSLNIEDIAGEWIETLECFWILLNRILTHKVIGGFE